MAEYSGSAFGTTIINLTIAPLTATGLGVADSTGNHPNYFDMGVARDKVTLSVVATGTPTTYSINLEGSLDGTVWESVGTVTQASSPAVVHSTGKAFTKWRANLTALTGGTTPTISAIMAASG